jgi:hypothetical protein
VSLTIAYVPNSVMPKRIRPSASGDYETCACRKLGSAERVTSAYLVRVCSRWCDALERAPLVLSP